MASQSYRELARWLDQTEPQLGSTRLVVVDGPAGSGKTTFAARLARVLEGARILHMDDFYEGWSGLDNRLWASFHSGVLEPLSRDVAGRYRRYDWDSNRFAEWHDVAPGGTLIAEGVGAGHRDTDHWATLRVWVEADEALRLDRGLRRDGRALQDEWLRWLQLEAEHFSVDGTRDRADLIVDGAAGDDPGSFTVLADRRPI